MKLLISKINRCTIFKVKYLIMALIAVVVVISSIWIYKGADRFNRGADSFESQLTKADNEWLYERGREYYRNGKLDSVLMHLMVIARRADDNSSEEQKEMSAEAFNDCGMIYFMMRNYPKAYNSFNQSISLGSERIKTLARNNLAALYYCFNDKERACKLLEEAAAGSLKVGEKDVLLSASLNLAIPYYENNDKNALQETLQRLEDADIPDDNPKKQYVSTVLKGYIALLNDAPDTALRIFRSIEKDNLGDGDKSTVDNFGNIYRAYFYKGDIDSALMMADKLMETPPGSPLSSEREMTAAQMRAECYAAMGNNAEELKAQRRYYELKDSLFSVKQYGEILNLHSAYEMDKAEERLQASDYRRRMHERYLLFAIVLIIVITIALARIFRQNRLLREMMQTLYEQANTKVLNKPGVPERDLEEESQIDSLEDEDQESARNITKEDDKALKELCDAIIEVMEKEKPWLSQDFSQRQLASMLESNMTYVSQSINRILGKSFSVFVNEYRIAESCRRFSDPDNYGHLTIEAVGTSVGFSSRSGFNAAFKKVTGLTPKDYISMARRG